MFLFFAWNDIVPWNNTLNISRNSFLSSCTEGPLGTTFHLSEVLMKAFIHISDLIFLPKAVSFFETLLAKEITLAREIGNVKPFYFPQSSKT